MTRTSLHRLGLIAVLLSAWMCAPASADVGQIKVAKGRVTIDRAGQELAGVSGWGDVLPVRWTLVRDDKGIASIAWRGTAGNVFTWGKVIDEEYLRYEVDDDRPAEASARGEARTEVHLPDRLLIFSSFLDLDGDADSLRYRFRRELRRDGVLIRERSWERRFRRDGH